MTASSWRWTAAILITYAVALAAWSWFATAVAPGLIARSLSGEGGPTLDRLVPLIAKGRALPVVQQEWRDASSAVAAALVVHAVLVLAILSWGRRREGASEGGVWLRGATSGFLILASLAFLIATIFAGAIQDYFLYLQIWREVLGGRDPWFLVLGGIGAFSLNAYGPLYNVLALPVLWNPLAPKLIFAAAYWFFASWLVLDLGGRRGFPAWGRLALAIWFAGPFAWVEIAYFGHFDVLVALLAVAAAEARLRGRWGASFGWLSAGVLLKFFPGVLAPFLALDRGRVRWRYLAAIVGLSLAGMAAAGAYWGPSLLRPLTLAVNRESAALSIFRYLRGPHSPIGRDTLFFAPDQYATPLLLLALYRAWSWTRRMGFEPLASCVLAVATTLLMYKVGFPQYYMVLFLIAPYWFVRDFARLAHRGPLATAFLACFAWISWFDLRLAREDPGPLVEWVGVPTFALMMAFVVWVAVAGPREQSPEGPA
ncbi:hypothetical protein [Paludisphaera soli]|uniref:hypothetical protein n=1 Tax=Paludisphaera soli TaxID=2712865 RepID=UPI0013EDCC63|nr:hypothetical protein [Paludisphaera soli]